MEINIVVLVQSFEITLESFPVTESLSIPKSSCNDYFYLSDIFECGEHCMDRRKKKFKGNIPIKEKVC